jgi:hypothetical protein
VNRNVDQRHGDERASAAMSDADGDATPPVLPTSPLKASRFSTRSHRWCPGGRQPGRRPEAGIDAAELDYAVDALDQVAHRWNQLTSGEALTLDWPWPERRRSSQRSRR